MTMADTIAVMNAGAIEQLGGPTELYESPATTFVANFLGQSNLVRARLSRADRATTCCSTSTAAGSRCRRRAASSGDDDLLIGIRPEKIHLVEPEPDGGAGENCSPAPWSPTPASPGSARSTSCGLAGARS